METLSHLDDTQQMEGIEVIRLGIQHGLKQPFRFPNSSLSQLFGGAPGGRRYIGFQSPAKERFEHSRAGSATHWKAGECAFQSVLRKGCASVYDHVPDFECNNQCAHREFVGLGCDSPWGRT